MRSRQLKRCCSPTVGLPAIAVRDRWGGCGRINLNNFRAVAVPLLSTRSTFRHNLGLWMYVGALAGLTCIGIVFSPFSTVFPSGFFLSLATAFRESLFQLFERLRYRTPEVHVGVGLVWNLEVMMWWMTQLVVSAGAKRASPLHLPLAAFGLVNRRYSPRLNLRYMDVDFRPNINSLPLCTDPYIQ